MGSSGFRNPIIGGGGALAYPSIHSPGYTPGVTGWSINKDGTAELINVTIRNATIPDVWLSGLSYPTGLGYTVQGETFPRILAQQPNSLNSATPRFTAINLAKGLTLTRMTMVVGNTPESGGTHGWYALLDVTGKVIAVTADQTGAAAWSPINTPVTLAFTASYKTTYRGVYYAMISVTGTQPPNIAGYAAGALAGAAGLAPVLGGLGTASSAPPALGTVIPLTAAAVGLYAIVG